MNKLEKLFPDHKCSLNLSHNDHKDCYETVEQYISTRDGIDDEDWATPTSKQRAIETNELWELRWYPNTPVGFNMILGATLEEVLKAATES